MMISPALERARILAADACTWEEETGEVDGIKGMAHCNQHLAAIGLDNGRRVAFEGVAEALVGPQ
jgi:hypothetical protein